MKVIIAGSRNLVSNEHVNWIFSNLTEFDNIGIKEVFSGCAKGPDTWGAIWAKTMGIEVREFRPDWNTHGKQAAFLRNIEMAEESDMLIVFWDGKSNGTKHMMAEMNRRGKKIHCFVWV